jgi:iron-sulfur cluster insertion protein
MNFLTITESAASRMTELVKEEGQTDHTKVRVFVQGGGCSGFEYGFTFDDDQNEDDFEITYGNSSVLIDSMSAQYLQGATIDYVEDLTGARFKIDNPNAQTTCGCGSSFSPF